MKDVDPIIASIESIEPGDVVLVGAPWDGGSSFLRGTALAPNRIRDALRSPSRNLSTESGIDLGTEPRFRMLADLALAETNEALSQIETAVAAIFDKGGRPLILGGDHSITLATVRACARSFQRLTLVHFDAHPDLYDELDGDRLSHACPMARIMEQELAQRLIQIGIRTMNPHQRQQAERFGAEVIEMRHWRPDYSPQIGEHDPIYLTIDLDGLDPAFAPGVSHPEPGGMGTRDLIRLLERLPNSIVAADLVELNPLRDLHDRTADVAAKLVKEMAAKLLTSETP